MPGIFWHLQNYQSKFNYHHHQILLFLAEHRACMKSFQSFRSPAIPLTSFHDLLVLLISSSVVLHHVLFGLPLLLYPWGFQSNAVFSIAPVALCNVCPIQFHFLLFIWFSIDFWWVILHSSFFIILLVHFIYIIRLKHLFANICSLLVIWLVIFQVSQAYNATDFTFVLNIHILTSFDMLRFLNYHHRGSTVVKVLCYKSEGRWFDCSWCQWIFHWHKILPFALWPWGQFSL